MKNYITIFADDMDADVWEDYCNACNVPLSATQITIRFKDEDISYEE